MADTKKTTQTDSPVSPIRPSESSGRAESPTTAQPLDFDDDQDANTPIRPTAPAPPPKDEAPPAKPPRPISARDQAENTLKEAFPTIDPSVVRAVLTASRGQVEPAFNALLGMSDPDSQRDLEPEQPPARPPRPPRAAAAATEQTQLEADEMYARQLHEHFNSAAPVARPVQANAYNEQLQGSRVGRPGAKAPEQPPVWRSFIDDELPEIRDTIQKSFAETQSTVNKWITNFKKTIDGDTDEPSSYPSQGRSSQVAANTNYNRRSGDNRRSTDLGGFDADPQVIGDDFSKLDLRDGDYPPRTTSRPLANPNLFKSGAERQKSPGIARKVSFQDGPPEEIRDMYSSSPKPATVEAPTPAGKTSRWQPLSKVEPSPTAENDPFSLGDSDDERDAKPITMKDDDELPAEVSGTAKDAKGDAKK